MRGSETLPREHCTVPTDTQMEYGCAGACTPRWDKTKKPRVGAGYSIQKGFQSRLACARLGPEGALVGRAHEHVALDGVGQHDVAEVGALLAEAEHRRRRPHVRRQGRQRLIACTRTGPH